MVGISWNACMCQQKRTTGEFGELLRARSILLPGFPEDGGQDEQKIDGSCWCCAVHKGRDPGKQCLPDQPECYEDGRSCHRNAADESKTGCRFPILLREGLIVHRSSGPPVRRVKAVVHWHPTSELG